MHQVGALVLWVLFSGGTVLAAGSVLSSIKRSMSGHTPMGRPQRKAVECEIPEETELETRAKYDFAMISEPAPLALPPLPAEQVEILEPAPPQGTASTRKGKNKKKKAARSGGPRKRELRKDSREAGARQRRKRSN